MPNFDRKYPEFGELESPFLSRESFVEDFSNKFLTRSFEKTSSQFGREFEVRYFERDSPKNNLPSDLSIPVQNDLSLAVPYFDLQEIMILQQPILNSRESMEAIKWNSVRHPKESGLNFTNISSVLQNYVDFNSVKQAIIDYNLINADNQIDLKNHEAEVVFVEAIHQFQKKCYMDKNTGDGKAGASVLDSLGFWQRRGLKTSASSNDWAQSQIRSKRKKIQMALDATPPELKTNIQAEKWWDSFVNPSFLGWGFNSPIHVYFARKLRLAERWLLLQPRFAGKTPIELAKILDIRENHVGGRSDPKSHSIHTLGLGMDIKYSSNPHIGDYRDKPLGAEFFCKFMRKAMAKSKIHFLEKTFPEYLFKLGSNVEKTTGAIYDNLEQCNSEFQKYLATSDQKENDEKKLRKGVFGGQGSFERDPHKGFLNLDRDLVIALRDQACLSWGAVDIGSSASGDIMHFDCRLDFIGRAVFEGANGSFNENHPCAHLTRSSSKSIKDSKKQEFQALEFEELGFAAEEYLENFEDESDYATELEEESSDEIDLNEFDGQSQENFTQQDLYEHQVSTTSAIHSGMEFIDIVPLLKEHHGTGPDLLISWNEMSIKPQIVDIVVHLHGHSGICQKETEIDLSLDCVPRSAIAWCDPSGRDMIQRQRPTLAVLPRGKQVNLKHTKYTFPALTKAGLNELIKFSLDEFAHRFQVSGLTLGRLILTVHSGGGDALIQLLPSIDPHEIHMLDAIYSSPDSVIQWAKKHIDQDRIALKIEKDPDGYMRSQGGALRIIYTEPTKQRSENVQKELSKYLLSDSLLEKWYRVEQTNTTHCRLPSKYAWRLLADASAQLPDVLVNRLRSHVKREISNSSDEAFEFEEEFEEEPQYEELISKKNTRGQKSTQPATDLVQFAQRVLNTAEGERLADDGNFGKGTRSAIERFRKRYELGDEVVLDSTTELALAQRALEELAQKSLFFQFGVLDSKTKTLLTNYKSKHRLGVNFTLDTATQTTLTDALIRRITLARRLPGFSPSEERALRVTNAIENTDEYIRTHDLVYGGLTGNSDGEGLSFGLLQFTIGTESLQPLLQQFEHNHTKEFEAVFGTESTELREMLTKSKSDQLTWARNINNTECQVAKPPSGTRCRLLEPWASHFNALSVDAKFRVIQLEKVRPVMNRAKSLATDCGLTSERGLVFMFDTVTQHGINWLDTSNYKPTRRKRIKDLNDKLKIQKGRDLTETELLEIMTQVIADTVKPEYSQDVLHRRQAIIRGYGRIHGHDFDLERDFGLIDLSWLPFLPYPNNDL